MYLVEGDDFMDGALMNISMKSPYNNSLNIGVSQKSDGNYPVNGEIPNPISGPQQNESASTASKRKRDGFDAECETCANRKYTDGSNDGGVSYKTPTKIDPKAAASAVMSHEREHVSREQSKAMREGREVVSQNVSLRTSICPECGTSYVSGGTTRTVTRGPADNYNVGKEENSKGNILNKAA